MTLCPICRRDITEEKKYLFLGEGGDYWLICKTCEQKLYHITNGKRKRWVHLSIADLSEKLVNNRDRNLTSYIRGLMIHRIREVGMHIPYL